MSSSDAPAAIDEGLYSRQLYVFDHESQARMQQAAVLIVGMRGLGVETAKNVILAGVKSVSLLDSGLATLSDCGANFYLSDAHVGQHRAHAVMQKLKTLNPYVAVDVVDAPLGELISSKRYSIVVLTDSTLHEAAQANELCRANSALFCWASIPGVYATIFVDFHGGRSGGHCVYDVSGEPALRGLVSHISSGSPGIVTCHDETRHGLQTGDVVTFEEVEGMIELNAGNTPPRPVKVISPFSFSIEDTTAYSAYTGTRGYFQQVKQPHYFHFKSLQETLMNDTPITNDWGGHERQLHVLHVALSQWRQQHDQQQPAPHIAQHSEEILQLAINIAQHMQPKVQLDQPFIRAVARCASAELNPLAAFMGGVLGQEILKGASAKFVPIQQYYYYDGSHVLPPYEDEKQNEIPVDYAQYQPLNSRYDSQIAVFGRSIQHRIENLSYFIVGAGAIGCEMLKNFAMIGIGTGKDSRVCITDMDAIERSNLNRQFLFRSDDVGKMKSIQAASAALKMNSSMHIFAQSLRVAPSTENVYNDAFWESLDGVVTALDNVEARLYVDQRCIYYQKPLIDSGTLGTKGSTQVIVPFLTESYGSSRDPPEDSIPICLLKNFPNKIEHTIQWARDLFEGLFKAAPAETNNYLTQANYLTELAKQPNVQLQNLQTIHQYLVSDKPVNFQSCIVWAHSLFHSEYFQKISQLLFTFPPDSNTSDGQPFWSGPKRAPTPIRFDPNDTLHVQFIMAAANLYAQVFGMKGSRDVSLFQGTTANLPLKPFVPESNKKIATTEAEAKEMMDQVDDEHESKVQNLIQSLPKPTELHGYHLHSIEFEKDDPNNFHIDFITACSNLRARNYAIKEVSAHETKFIAGKIIPAIATTTALVTGMVCMEIYKLVQNKKRIEDYRNFSCNLALSIFTAAEPIAPATTTTHLKSGDWKFSLWDRIDVDIGDVTLQEFMDHIQERFGVEVNILSHGAAMIFYNFGVVQKKVKERLNQKLSDLVTSVGNYQVGADERYLTFEACVVNDDGDDVEIPYVRYKFRS